MRIAVTGISGFIGARLAYELRTSHELIPLGRTSAHDTPSFDLAQPARLRQELEIVHADAIIHAGAMARHRLCNAKPALANTINVDATSAIAVWASTHDVPMIFLSTVGVNEDNVYANTKFMAERCVQASGARACIMRLAYTFGWSPSTSRPGPQLRLEAEATKPGSQTFDDSWKFQPTSLTHVCRVLEAILTRQDTLPPNIDIVTSCPTTMHGLASACLTHETRASDELGGRMQQYIDTTELIAEGLPVVTMKVLVDEIRVLMQSCP